MPFGRCGKAVCIRCARSWSRWSRVRIAYRGNSISRKFLGEHLDGLDPSRSASAPGAWASPTCSWEWIAPTEGARRSDAVWLAVGALSPLTATGLAHLAPP